MKWQAQNLARHASASSGYSAADGINMIDASPMSSFRTIVDIDHGL